MSILDVLQKKIVLTDLLGLIAGQHSKSSRSIRQDHITEAGWCRSTNIPKRPCERFVFNNTLVWCDHRYIYMALTKCGFAGLSISSPK